MGRMTSHMENKKIMFETTNQLCMCWHIWTANRAIYATSAPTRHPPHPRDRLSRDDPPETFLSVRRSCSWPSGNVLLVAIEAMPIEIVDLC